MPPTRAEMDKIRLPYLKLESNAPAKLIQLGDLKWFPVKLSVPIKDNATGLTQTVDCGTIDVCSPVRKDDLFIPASKAELWDLARRLNTGLKESEKLYPLTRAVADLVQNTALYEDPTVEYGAMQGDLFDFVKYSGLLNKNNYKDSNSRLVSGCHKYWPLTAHSTDATRGVNYGFYVPRKIMKDPGGRYLNQRYGVINGLLKGHDTTFWDYSQLIQFMRKPRGNLRELIIPCTVDKPLTIAGSPSYSPMVKALNDFNKLATKPPVIPSLKDMLLKGYPGLWDEDDPDKGVTKRLTAAAFP